MKDGDAHVVVPAILGVILKQSASSVHATGASCADSGAHATHWNVVRRSVLCDTVRGEGHKVFMDRWLWAVGTGM